MLERLKKSFESRRRAKALRFIKHWDEAHPNITQDERITVFEKFIDVADAERAIREDRRGNGIPLEVVKAKHSNS